MSEHSVEETYLPGGLEPLTEEEIERREWELKMESHIVAWERMKRAINSASNGSAPDRAAVAAEVRCAAALIAELDVRQMLLREAEKVAKENSIDLRAHEIARERSSDPSTSASRGSDSGGVTSLRIMAGSGSMTTPIEPAL